MTVNIEQLYKIYLSHPIVSTDTRKISEGCIFFALKGDKFDANTFARQALAAGAAYAVIDNAAYQANDRCLLVDDVLTTLQELARHHRRQLTIPIIGLTGTNGKTTTKELISSVLAQHFTVQFTQGNLNNHIGVPLTVLTIDAADQVAVIEMGANHQKEIGFLCTISQPTHGLITNVGKAHLEGFGGVEGVKKGKGELYDYLKTEEEHKQGGIAFVNHDDAALMEMQQARRLEKVTYYGPVDNPGNLVSGEILENSPYLTIRWKNHQNKSAHKVRTQLTGEYNLSNILVAACIGVYFGLSNDEISAGIENYQPQNSRSQIVRTGSNLLICDYYNANPSSMAVAIENMGKLSAARKVLILGDMFELGEEASAEHKAVIAKALEIEADAFIFIGKEFAKAASKNDTSRRSKRSVRFYRTTEEAIDALSQQPVEASTVLIKGSRGMALERLAPLFNV